MAFERDLNLEATELRLGPPGTATEELEKQTLPSSAAKSNKRPLLHLNAEAGPRDSSDVSNDKKSDQETVPPIK